MASSHLLVELPGTSRARIASPDGLVIHTSEIDRADPAISAAGTWDLGDEAVQSAACQFAGRVLNEEEWAQYPARDEAHTPSCSECGY